MDEARKDGTAPGAELCGPGIAVFNGSHFRLGFPNKGCKISRRPMIAGIDGEEKAVGGTDETEIQTRANGLPPCRP